MMQTDTLTCIEWLHTKAYILVPRTKISDMFRSSKQFIMLINK
jgi:hypothetical protein